MRRLQSQRPWTVSPLPLLAVLIVLSLLFPPRFRTYLAAALPLFVVTLLLLVVGIALWRKLRHTTPATPVDFFSDVVFAELRSICREMLLPLGFSEKQEVGPVWVCSAEYHRNEAYVVIGKDMRDNFYFFFAGTKSEEMKLGRESIMARRPDVKAESYSKRVEDFRDETRTKLSAWLLDENLGVEVPEKSDGSPTHS